MNKPELAEFYNRLSKTKRKAFCEQVGLKEVTLRQIISTNKLPSAKTCIKIEKASGGRVTRKILRPDDWREIWPTNEQKITSGYYLKKKPGFFMFLLLTIFGY